MQHCRRSCKGVPTVLALFTSIQNPTQYLSLELQDDPPSTIHACTHLNGAVVATGGTGQSIAAWRKLQSTREPEVDGAVDSALIHLRGGRSCLS